MVRTLLEKRALRELAIWIWSVVGRCVNTPCFFLFLWESHVNKTHAKPAPLPLVCFSLLLLPPPLCTNLPVGRFATWIPPLSFLCSFTFCKPSVTFLWIEYILPSVKKTTSQNVWPRINLVINQFSETAKKTHRARLIFCGAHEFSKTWH